MYVAHTNDRYFESIYWKNEVQEFSESDKAIIADTPNLDSMDSERKAEPITLASDESPLKHLERVADKLHNHIE